MKLEDIGFYSLSDERARNASAHSQMMRCEMIINEYCDFKCPYCRGLASEVFSDRTRKELTLDEMKLNIDLWCDHEPLKNIRFSGGEPTYHKHLFDAVVYAKKKGIQRIAVSTNGANKRSVYEYLIRAGVNDFSISLDAADARTGDMMAGNIPGAWAKVVKNIEWIAKETYVTVGVVLEPDNVSNFIDIVEFADDLGVADIRVIPSAQWDKPLTELSNIKQEVLDRHPILKYRVRNFIKGNHIRGIPDDKTGKCALVLDDSVIAGQKHYPCVIYMREQGKSIGPVNKNMRGDRVMWFDSVNTHNDPICKANCLDACIDYNNKATQYLI